MKVLKFSFIALPVLVLAMALYSCNNDDEPTPDPEPDPVNISVSDLSVDEGNGYVNINIQLELDAAAEQQVSVNISTTDGSAEANKDYVPVDNEPIVFAVGETSKTYEITIAGDLIFEEDEYFEVTLSNVSGPGTIADGTARVDLLNDDAMGEQDVPVDLAVDWDELENLAPGSEVPYEIMNFGQPSNVPNSEFTSVVNVGDEVVFNPSFSPSGDTILYKDFTFEPGFEWQQYITIWKTFVDDSLGTQINIEITNNEIDDLNVKYDFTFMLGTTDQGRLGPFMIDPKLRIQG